MPSEIPSQARAAVRQGAGKSATTTIQLVDVPKPGPGEILVKVTWTGVCGTDKSILLDEWEELGIRMKPSSKGIAGHEGAGVVASVGSEMQQRWKVGDRVGLKWIASTCGQCNFCTDRATEIHCPHRKVNGSSIPGTFQEYCLADGRHAVKLPEGVADEEAGPIMCGGVTAYAACKRSAVKPGQWIVVLGAGGGLGHLAIQYARAMGMRVIAVDGGEAKHKMCLELGAEQFIDIEKTDDIKREVKKSTTHGAHGVVVTAANRAAYESAPFLLRPRGTMVAVGLPKDKFTVVGAAPMLIVMMQLNIVGSVVGSSMEIDEALDFTARGLVRPILSKGELGDLDFWLKQIDSGQLAGRAVLQVS